MAGPVAGAHRVDDARHRGRGGDDVVAVDRGVVDPVALGAALERRRVLVRRRRELRVAVVLAEEDHRQLPHRGQVHRFVERALCHRAVAEERDHHGAVGAQLRGGRRADRDRQARGHDAVGPEDADRRIGDVHRAAAPTVRPRVLGHQLGEHPGRVEALRQAVTVAAVGRGDHVVRAERPARADGRGLLPDREVHEAGDLTVAVQRGDPLLEAADHEHPAVQLEQVGVA